MSLRDWFLAGVNASMWLGLLCVSLFWYGPAAAGIACVMTSLTIGIVLLTLPK
jgi:hypothetical protein